MVCCVTAVWLSLSSPGVLHHDIWSKAHWGATEPYNLLLFALHCSIHYLTLCMQTVAKWDFALVTSSKWDFLNLWCIAFLAECDTMDWHVVSRHTSTTVRPLRRIFCSNQWSTMLDWNKPWHEAWSHCDHIAIVWYEWPFGTIAPDDTPTTTYHQHSSEKHAHLNERINSTFRQCLNAWLEDLMFGRTPENLSNHFFLSLLKLSNIKT